MLVAAPSPTLKVDFVNKYWPPETTLFPRRISTSCVDPTLLLLLFLVLLFAALDLVLLSSRPTPASSYSSPPHRNFYEELVHRAPYSLRCKFLTASLPTRPWPLAPASSRSMFLAWRSFVPLRFYLSRCTFLGHSSLVLPSLLELRRRQVLPFGLTVLLRRARRIDRQVVRFLVLCCRFLSRNRPQLITLWFCGPLPLLLSLNEWSMGLVQTLRSLIHCYILWI